MNNVELLQKVKERAGKWLAPVFDEDTRAQVRYMLDNDEAGLVDSFYRDLEFGTGGLRGIMGAGTNRMNIYTLGMATQGLCNYLKREFSELDRIKVVIAHDSRNNSRLYAETTADIFTANDIRAYLFDSLRPTPELSFAIRHFQCKAGVVITASHNPKEYNGYKVYWEDGGQIINPHDKNIIREVQKISSVDEVKFEGDKSKLEIIGSEFDEIYTDRIKSLSLSPDIISRNKDLKIVYTPIHGTGVKLIPMVLKKYGFTNIINVPEQDVISGDFPTVKSPNPEESEALKLAIKKAEETDADLVMATDPDSDRVGVVIKDNEGKYVIINGNQAAALLINYLLSQWSGRNKLKGNEYIVKTIVTTELLADIAEKYNIEHFDVLTGFKFIADVIKQLEGKKVFIGGGEESYGYLAGDFVRDKDAVISCALIAEATAWAKDQGKSMFELLLDIYMEYGMYKEKLVNVVKKGREGADEIKKMMKQYRDKPPEEIGGSKVTEIRDYLDEKSLEKINSENGGIIIPKADVIQLFTENGSKISIRPSGTEPKIKFYFSVKDVLKDAGEYEKVNEMLDKRIDAILQDMGI
jgi:phosphoglucomutase